MEENENRDLAAERASEAAYEFQISQETRDFLKGIQVQGGRKSSIRPLVLTGVAASVLVLIISVISINISHNGSSIADKYGINAIVARSGSNISDDQFREAVQKYYAKDFEGAESILLEMGDVEGRLADYKDWLNLLLELKTQGSESAQFQQILDSIILNEDHEFHLPGMKMKSDIDLFWRSLVVKK